MKLRDPLRADREVAESVAAPVVKDNAPPAVARPIPTKVTPAVVKFNDPTAGVGPREVAAKVASPVVKVRPPTASTPAAYVGITVAAVILRPATSDTLPVADKVAAPVVKLSDPLAATSATPFSVAAPVVKLRLPLTGAVAAPTNDALPVVTERVPVSLSHTLISQIPISQVLVLPATGSYWNPVADSEAASVVNESVPVA